MSNKRIPFLNLPAQNNEIRTSLLDAFEEVLDSGVYVSGTRVAKFEEAFGAILGVEYVVACNSGTSALILALQALGVGSGDEVIVPGMTFIATIEAVVAVGATPVLVDVNSETWNLDVDLAKEKLTPKTKVVVFVHLHGNPVGILSARQFCDENGLFLVEDAAQAHLAEVDDKMVGSFGDVAAFSFYPGKNLGALGEGGSLTTNNPSIYEKAKLIRNWGSQKKYEHETRGTNYRMDEIQGAFLEIKLRELDRWTHHRENLSRIYNVFFDDYGVHRPFTCSNSRHSFHIYAIVTDMRDDLRTYLSEQLIETGIHYPTAISQMKPWQEYFLNASSNPVSESLAKGFLSLPLSEQHSEVEIHKVTEVIKEFLELNQPSQHH